MNFSNKVKNTLLQDIADMAKTGPRKMRLSLSRFRNFPAVWQTAKQQVMHSLIPKLLSENG